MVSQVVETGFPEFTTFSVGESVDRRTVVCFQQQLLDYTLGNIRWEKARDTGEFVTAPGPGLMVQHDSAHQDKLDTNFLTEAVTCQPEAGDLRGCEPPSAVPSPAPDLTPTKAKPPGSRKSRKRPERAAVRWAGESPCPRTRSGSTLPWRRKWQPRPKCLLGSPRKKPKRCSETRTDTPKPVQCMIE